MASEHNYTQSFSVEGMTCASCVRIVERSLKKLDGISYVSVNLATQKALVLSDVPIDQELVRQTVEKTGYGYQAESPVLQEKRNVK